MTEFETYFDEEIIEAQYDSDGDEIVEIEEYVYETDSNGESYYEEEVVPDLPAVIEEDEEDEKSEDEPEPEKVEEESEEEDDRPAWANMKLKKTAKGELLKKDGNLAAPITFTPFKNTDFTNRAVDKHKLKKTEEGTRLSESGNLAAAITNTPFKNTDHTNYVANQNRLKSTEVSDAVKKGESLAAPITNIRDDLKKKKKSRKLVTRKVKKRDLDTKEETRPDVLPS
jgi:phage gpG-like protein